MIVKVLSSGSKGNSTLIKTKNINILIDAGISAKELKKRIGVDNLKIDYLFITHAHTDHTKGLKSIYKEFKPIVYTNNKEVIESGIVPTKSIDENLILDSVTINCFNLSHDSDCVGFCIKELDKEIVYITDTGYIKKDILASIENKDMYILESNHDEEMLRHGKYPFFLQQRILSDKGHLSNHDASKYLRKIAGDKTRYIVLAHLSEENNTKELAFEELEKALKKADKKVKNIYIAKQEESLEEIEV